jgi:hypothetical protein
VIASIKWRVFLINQILNWTNQCVLVRSIEHCYT